MIEYRDVALERMAVEGTGVFSGYASIFGVPNEYDETVEPGAFTRTLDHWASSGRVIPILWQHSSTKPIGATVKIAEDQHGLSVTGQLILEVAQAAEAFALMKANVLGGLSIGFTAIKEAIDPKTQNRILQEVRLWEYSPVTWPAQPEATISEVHGMSPKNISEKLAPIGAAWSKPTLADFTSQTWGELTTAQKRAIAGHYAWEQANPPATFGGLKLPHHRPSDGAVVWRAVSAAMAALLGARGGVTIPAADRKAVYNHLAAHYKQFDRTPPEFHTYTEIEVYEMFPDLDDVAQIRALLVDLKNVLPTQADPGNHSADDGLSDLIQQIITQARSK